MLPGSTYWHATTSEYGVGALSYGGTIDLTGETPPTSISSDSIQSWVADELTSAADLARRKDGRQPVVLVRGAGRYVTPADGPGAAALLRPEADDLFR